jgi:predicted P-loop ATPase
MIEDDDGPRPPPKQDPTPEVQAMFDQALKEQRAKEAADKAAKEAAKHVENEAAKLIVLPPSASPKKIKGTNGAKPATNGAKPPTDPSGEPQLESRKNPSGHAASLQNTIEVVKRLPVTFRHDVFHDKMLIEGRAIGINHGDSIDDVCLKVRTAIIGNQNGFDPGTPNIHDAVRIICLANEFDPILDYLNSLKHDGTSRIDTWLTTYLGAEDNELNRAVGRKVLIAAVRRARSPGCKFDTILVLEGEVQGRGKSTALRDLAGDENFSDAEILSADQRTQQEQVRGVWIYELAELAGLRKADVERVKQFASKTCDSARPAYGRSRVDQPRRCIFIGTTNDSKYLQDATGNRRFWPVTTDKIDLDALRRDRDQLWAEAAACEAQGEPLTLDPSLWAAAGERQASRLISDPWEDILSGLESFAPMSAGSIVLWQGAPGEPSEWRVSSDYVCKTFLRLDPDRVNSSTSRRLGAVMRRLGWTGPKPIRFQKVVQGYTKPATDAADTKPADTKPASAAE